MLGTQYDHFHTGKVQKNVIGLGEHRQRWNKIQIGFKIIHTRHSIWSFSYREKYRKMLLAWVNIGRDEIKFKLASKWYMLGTQYDHFHTRKVEKNVIGLGKHR
jgi:hypothetical protein